MGVSTEVYRLRAYIKLVLNEAVFCVFNSALYIHEQGKKRENIADYKINPFHNLLSYFGRICNACS